MVGVTPLGPKPSGRFSRIPAVTGIRTGANRTIALTNREGVGMETAKRILVTGGAGFIGSNLCRSLLQAGAEVDCVDNLITGRMAAVSPLRSSRRFRFFLFDVADRDFTRTFADFHYDEIYHLACPTGVPNIPSLGEEMLRTCATGTENVLRLACARNARVLYTSSAEVYGDPRMFPQGEDYCGDVSPVGPRSAYEEGKRYGEAILKMFVDKYEIDARIVRVFNTFGRGMSPEDTRLIPSFLRRLSRGEKIIIYGDGTQTRTHLYIDDLLAGFHYVMQKGQAGEAYNVGGERQMSVAGLAQLLGELTSTEVAVEYRPHFTEDHAGRQPLLTKVKALGWSPRVDITEGLCRMLPDYGISLAKESRDDDAIAESLGAG